MKIKYLINMPDDLKADILGFSEEITIEVSSKDPDREFDILESGYYFGRWMLQALREWYDGADVMIDYEENE